MSKSYRTPGVFLNELHAFPASIVPVATAVPAFIGYTPRASYQGKSCLGLPVPISSFAEFQACFCLLDPTTQQPLPPHQQYAPIYHLLPAASPARADLTLGGTPCDLCPDAGSIYYFYNSIRLFFQNGGGACYVVSVGTYGRLRGAGTPKGQPLINPNLDLNLFLAALATLTKQTEPTLVVIPDATLLSATDNATLNQQALIHCGQMQSRIVLFDLPGAAAPDPATWQTDLIAPFRASVGQQFLGYGAAYYPFLQTSVMSDAEIDFTNLADSARTLAALLPGANQPPVQSLLAAIGQTGAGVPTPAQIESGLRQASPAYQQLHALLLARSNILPPSGAMAGVYTTIDQTYGVWKAPANCSIVNAFDVTQRLSDDDQSGLNVDAATGKSINALRLFPGQGLLVWGARTLDGNSQDWRYISVRRTVICLEQSIKLAVRAFAFEPNVANTWVSVRSMIDSFLTSQWKAGALIGDKPTDAFSVSCGLGSTMTAQDILDGVMNVSVQVALTHPAEFIVITIRQQMQTS